MPLRVCEVSSLSTGIALDPSLSTENICSRIALIVVFFGITAFLVENLLIPVPQSPIPVFCPVYRSLAMSIEITFLVVDVGQAMFQKQPIHLRPWSA